MDHQNIKEKLWAYRDFEISGPEQQEIFTHLQSCRECSFELNRLQTLGTKLKRIALAAPSEFFVRKVMDRLGDLEEAAKPMLKWAFMDWLLPLTGYAFAFFLMFLAISHREAPVNASAVLLADVPQGAQWTFSSEAPDINKLLGVQGEDL